MLCRSGLEESCQSRPRKAAEADHGEGLREGSGRKQGRENSDVGVFAWDSGGVGPRPVTWQQAGGEIFFLLLLLY